MNTFSYISSIFSTRPQTASFTSTRPNSSPRTNDNDNDNDTAGPTHTSPEPVPSTSTLLATTTTNQDTDTESNSSTAPQPQGETIYLSARRSSRPGERPRISFSLTTPPHLVGLTANTVLGSENAWLRPQDVPLPGGGEGEGEGEDDEDEKDDGCENDDEKEEGDWSSDEARERREERSKRALALAESEREDLEGERKLQLREKEREAIELASRMWPVRFGVSIYILLRHLFSYVGFGLGSTSSLRRLMGSTSGRPLASPSASASSSHAIPTIDPTLPEDQDELLAQLDPSFRPTSKILHQPTTTFFLRRTTPPPLAPDTATSSPSTTRSSSPLRVTPTSKTSQNRIPNPQPPRLTPKTLVLDLDETLIHSTSRPYNNGARHGLKVRVVEVVLEGRSTVYTVYKRPWVDFFLRKVSTWYTVIIFTASLPEYADPVIDWLDGGDGGGGMVGGRLFRSDCLHSNGAYVKDLSVVDADLSRVCLVDNSPVSYAINQANGIPIEGWINDPNDECLLDLLPMLDSLRFTSDVRRVLGLRGAAKT